MRPKLTNKILSFRIVGDAIYPNKQLVGTFFVAREIIVSDSVEVRPLTVGNLLFCLLRNYFQILYWGIARFCWRAGMLDTPFERELDWKKDWRWNWSAVRAARKARGEVNA